MTMPFGVNRYDPGNPANPINQYSPSNPLNPVNRYHPDNPLNPANQYNADVSFAPLDGGRSRGTKTWQGPKRDRRTSLPSGVGCVEHVGQFAGKAKLVRPAPEVVEIHV